MAGVYHPGRYRPWHGLVVQNHFRNSQGVLIGVTQRAGATLPPSVLPKERKNMKNKIISTILLIAIILPLYPEKPAFAQSELIEVEIQPDGANMKDATITEQSPNANNGSYDYLSVGEETGNTLNTRALLEFDLSGLPGDADIQSATLTLTVKNDYSDNGGTLYVYIINENWSENEVTWNHRLTIVPWGEAGAMGAGDILTTPVGSVTIDGNLQDGDEVVITITDLGIINQLIKQNYFGFLLKMEAENNDLYQYYSSDSTSETYRPKLSLSYYPSDESVVDPGWLCVNGSGFTPTPFFNTCYPESTTTSPQSPFDMHGLVENGSYGIGKGIMAADLLCEPFPRCVNDYPIYYRFEYDFTWTSSSGGQVSPSFWFHVAGVGDISISGGNIFCDTGNIGHCDGVYEGVIYTSQLPADHDGNYVIGVYATLDNHIFTIISGSALSFQLYLSLQPFDQNCLDTYHVPEPETFIINPNLEEPVGAPSDTQMYPTVVGNLYMVRVIDGPWSDGSNDRTDAAVSLDGETWISWSNFAEQAVCITYYPETYGILDYQVLFFTATTETFYIRVNDGAGAFADNSNNIATPYSYMIGRAFLLSESECDASFSFDQGGDLFAEATINSASDGTVVNDDNPMQTGEWYAIEVESGSWNEPGGDSRTDMEFLFSTLSSGGFTSDWADLADGSDFVWCAGANLIYIQAPAEVISLRVNDQDGNFTNNTGALDINIYHVSYTYNPEGCAETFNVDNIVASGSVRGDQANGMPFANNLLNPGLATSYAMVPGGWYVLETRGGPWWLRDSMSSVGGDYQPGNLYYDVQFKTEKSDANSEWVNPDDWNLATCVVEIDALGHIRVYFQVPNNNGGDLNQGGAEYFVRAAGASFIGMGEISWDLYQAVDVPSGNNPWDSCYSQYINTSSVPLNDLAWIPVKEQGGTAIIQYGATGGGASVLAPNQDYWLETKNGPWYDGENMGGEEGGGSNGGAKYTAQISSDGGVTWYNFSDHPDVFCAEVDPFGAYQKAFFSVSVGQSWKIRVADVESAVFTDNTGTLAYTLHAVNPHGFPITTDDITDENFEVCAPVLVRPYIPGMIYSSPSINAPPIPSSWDVQDWVMYLGDWFGALGAYIGDVADIAINNVGAFFSGFGRYIGEWTTYINRSFVSYFAWCPRHVNIILTTINKLQDKEPVATIIEIRQTADTAWAEVNSYDWGTAGEGGGEGDAPEYVSIFSYGEGGGEGDNTNVVDYIFERFFPMTGPGVNIWTGEGDIVVFGSAELPSYYYTCNDVFGEFLPERLRQGVCFTSAHWRETGAWWWIQLSIDVSSAFLVFAMIKRSVQELIYMMTGVKPWVKDSARGMEKLIDHLERADRTSGGSTAPLIGRGRGPRAG